MANVNLIFKALEGKVMHVETNFGVLNRDTIRIPLEDPSKLPIDGSVLNQDLEILVAPKSFNFLTALGKIDLMKRACEDGHRYSVHFPVYNEEALFNWIMTNAKNLSAIAENLPSVEMPKGIRLVKWEPVFSILSHNSHGIVGPWSGRGILFERFVEKTVPAIAAAYHMSENLFPACRDISIPGRPPIRGIQYLELFNAVSGFLAKGKQPPLRQNPLFMPLAG